MEESKELQGLYTIFRATIYISLLLEFFMYALDPSSLTLTITVSISVPAL